MPNSFNMTYGQMETRYGHLTAYWMLEQFERAAGLPPNAMTGIAPEIRLANATRIQDAAFHVRDFRADVLRSAHDMRLVA